MWLHEGSAKIRSFSRESSNAETQNDCITSINTMALESTSIRWNHACRERAPHLTPVVMIRSSLRPDAIHLNQHAAIVLEVVPLRRGQHEIFVQDACAKLTRHECSILFSSTVCADWFHSTHISSVIGLHKTAKIRRSNRHRHYYYCYHHHHHHLWRSDFFQLYSYLALNGLLLTRNTEFRQCSYDVKRTKRLDCLLIQRRPPANACI